VSRSFGEPLDFLSACSVNSVKKKNPIAQKMVRSLCPYREKEVSSVNLRIFMTVNAMVI
jgi:hypothetical protein